jgi:competence protein ComEC
MGRKKKKNQNKEIIKIIASFAILIVVYILSRNGVFQQIDEMFANTGLIEKFETIENSNVTTTSVKKDTEIISSVAESITIQNDKLNILYLNVGQADCELIISNGKTMLIDAGNRSDGELIVNALNGLGITKLDYVVGTHVHEDHIGGMSYIVDSFDIGEFYLPYNTTTTSSYYKKLLTSLSQKNLSVSEAEVGNIINLGNSTIEVMSVRNDEPENINEESIVLELTYGNLKYLFMGDAETSNEKLRTWNDVDVLKVGHHGSNTSSSEDFLKQVLPEISIISVGKDNSYGLPKDKIIERLKNIGTQIYRTDEDGTIQIVSDGVTNEVIKIDISFDGN